MHRSCGSKTELFGAPSFAVMSVILVTRDRENYNRYMKEYMKRRRAEQKETDENRSLANMDLNYGMKPFREEFISFEEWKTANPDGRFQDYLKEKIQFDEEQRVRPLIYDSYDEVFGKPRKAPRKHRLSLEQEQKQALAYFGDDNEP